MTAGLVLVPLAVQGLSILCDQKKHEQMLPDQPSITPSKPPGMIFLHTESRTKTIIERKHNE
jgi:hypothetical protein